VNIKPLPEINASLIVFGGPYSNLQALEAIKAICDADNVPGSRVICTGDIVAYGAQPAECIDFVRQWKIHVIAGNVELQLAADKDDCGCNFNKGSVCDALSDKWYTFARQRISASQIQWLSELPRFLTFNCAGYAFNVVHGAYSQTAKFIYRSTPWNTKLAEFDQTRSDVVLAGHCGIPFIQSNDNKVWANAGVIGMPPNDGTTLGWYMTITPGAQELILETKSFQYDNLKAAKLIENENLAVEYAYALRNGIWPSNDILPVIERRQQGHALQDEKITLPVKNVN
jgi:predicted phosphodiesterase